MKAEEILEEVMKNIRIDRATIQVQITDLNKSLSEQSDMSKHASYSVSLTKYAETLQRSNDQLIKVADMKRKIEEETDVDEEEETDVDKMYEELGKEE